MTRRATPLRSPRLTLMLALSRVCDMLRHEWSNRPTLQSRVKAKHTGPASSRTPLLLRAGRGKIGKEVGEETAEVIIEAMRKHRQPPLQSNSALGRSHATRAHVDDAAR